MLPKMTSTEGIVFYMQMRRKWFIRWYPEQEDYFKKTFKSNENIIHKIVIKGGNSTCYDVISKINYLKLILHESVGKILVTRTGERINLSEFYRQYPEGFSIVFSYEPKNLLKTAKQFSLSLTKTLFDYTENDEWIIRNLDKEWIRCVHKKSRRDTGDKFLLLDFDCNLNSKYLVKEKIWFKLQKYLKSRKLDNNIDYAVTTPSCGLHCVLKIDRNVEYIIFKQRDKFFNEIEEAIGFRPEMLVRDFMTHVPFNSNVYILYNCNNSEQL